MLHRAVIYCATYQKYVINNYIHTRIGPFSFLFKVSIIFNVKFDFLQKKKNTHKDTHIIFFTGYLYV